jgi:hypothetical protein
VIGLLGDPKVDVAAIEMTVERLGRLFDELRGSSKASLELVAAHTSSLNAVAQQLAARQLEEVAEHIALARRLQLALDRSCEVDSTGGYCDVER